MLHVTRDSCHDTRYIIYFDLLGGDAEVEEDLLEGGGLVPLHEEAGSVLAK